MTTKKNKNKYDYSLKDKKDRSHYIEERLGYILELPPYMLMGYSNSSRTATRKYNRIPKLMDGYTSYLLESQDVGSSRKIEYPFYISERDERRRKNNHILYHQSDCFDGSEDSDDSGMLSHSETHIDSKLSFDGLLDYGFEDNDSQVVKYAISKSKLNSSEYKKVLSLGSEVLFKSKDEELKEMIEQIIFNCAINCQDDTDTKILKRYLTGSTMREISEIVDMSHVSVSKRIDKMLNWVTG